MILWKCTLLTGMHAHKNFQVRYLPNQAPCQWRPTMGLFAASWNLTLFTLNMMDFAVPLLTIDTHARGQKHSAFDMLAKARRSDSAVILP